MYPPVVVVHDEPADGGVQPGQRQRCGGDLLPVVAGRDVPGQSGQQFGGQGAEELFDLAPSAGLSRVRCGSAAPFRSAQTWAMWEPVKSAPWSLYNVDGSPHTGHCGSLLRHTACRNANAVCAAVGASRNTVYPATAREWSSSTTVNHGRAGLARSSSTITSSSV